MNYSLILVKLWASFTSMNVFVLIGTAAEKCIFSPTCVLCSHWGIICEYPTIISVLKSIVIEAVCPHKNDGIITSFMPNAIKIFKTSTGMSNRPKLRENRRAFSRPKFLSLKEATSHKDVAYSSEVIIVFGNTRCKPTIGIDLTYIKNIKIHTLPHIKTICLAKKITY